MRKMFRALVLIASVLLACVACDAGKVGSGVSVCISFSIQRARAIGASTDFDVADVATWKYTAHKVNGGLKTGETTEQVALTDGKSTGPLSQGIWDFEVFGYKSAGSSGDAGSSGVDGSGASTGSSEGSGSGSSASGSEASGSSSAEVLVCYGKVSNVRITESEHSVSVLVAPRQVGQGSIAIGEISLVNSSGVVVATGTGSSVVSGSGACATGDSSSGDASGSGVTYSRNIAVYKHDDESTTVDYSGSVASGSYKVVVSYSSADTVVGTATLYVNVYDNLTTTVSGTVGMTE